MLDKKEMEQQMKKSLEQNRTIKDTLTILKEIKKILKFYFIKYYDIRITDQEVVIIVERVSKAQMKYSISELFKLTKRRIVFKTLRELRREKEREENS